VSIFKNAVKKKIRFHNLVERNKGVAKPVFPDMHKHSFQKNSYLQNDLLKDGKK